VPLGGDLLAPGATLKDWLKDPKQHAASRDGTAALISGQVDVTDTLMKALGQDPYRAERMKMLDATREQRPALSAHERTARPRRGSASIRTGRRRRRSEPAGRGRPVTSPGRRPCRRPRPAPPPAPGRAPPRGRRGSRSRGDPAGRRAPPAARPWAS